MEFNWNNEPLIITKDKYHNERIALVMTHKDTGEPYGKATVNLPDCCMDQDEVAIKDYAENEGILEALIEQGFISTPDRHDHSNLFMPIPICKLLV